MNVYAGAEMAVSLATSSAFCHVLTKRTDICSQDGVRDANCVLDSLMHLQDWIPHVEAPQLRQR